MRRSLLLCSVAVLSMSLADATAQSVPKAAMISGPSAGVVLLQFVRCSRPNCRCARGQLHGPYHYRFWREDGRLRKAYVRRSELEEVRAQCEARRQARRDVRAAWEEWRGMAALAREVEQSCTR